LARLNCCVPGCKRSTSRFGDDAAERGVRFICGPHWSTVPRSWKRRLSLFKRRATKAFRTGDADQLERAQRAIVRAWARIEGVFAQAEPIGDELPSWLTLHLRDLALD